MDRKTVLFVATVGCVAVVVSLAMTVSLWPDKKVQDRGKAGASSQNSAAKAGAPMATANAAKKAPPASAPKSLGMSEITAGANAAGNTIRTEIGTALVRDPETGKMKEVPYTAQVMIMRGPDGKGIKILGGPASLTMRAPDGSFVQSDGGEGTFQLMDPSKPLPKPSGATPTQTPSGTSTIGSGFSGTATKPGNH